MGNATLGMYDSENTPALAVLGLRSCAVTAAPEVTGARPGSCRQATCDCELEGRRQAASAPCPLGLTAGPLSELDLRPLFQALVNLVSDMVREELERLL